MRALSFPIKALCAALVPLAVAGGFARAEPSHGIAMYGTPALPPDFAHLPYANPDAPKGGRLVIGEVTSYDSLNPLILKGSSPWLLRLLGYESLMIRAWSEPFTLYCLLCESIDTGPNREWVEFTLRPEAAFSDGSPVTVDDVMWSYETLGTLGHPRYHSVWNAIESMEQTGPRSLRFTFNAPNRELALLIGMRPILKKAQWQDRDFTESGLDNPPITTAPYQIGAVDVGRSLTLTRNPDYWGKDLPVTQGLANLDEIRMEMFADEVGLFEAFKGGLLNSNREFNAEKWQTQYDFPAIQRGDVIKDEIPHGRPSGIRGFVMNTRRGVFADWRVRQAMLEMFNFEYINDSLTAGRQPRITSYFSNSDMAMREGPAPDAVRDLLEPFAETLLPGALDGYSLPVSDPSRAAPRASIRRANRLMADAGYTVDSDGVLKDAQGRPFSFSILLKNGSADDSKIADIFVTALKEIGVFATINSVDAAQYNSLVANYDFDMTSYWRGLSLSPGNEQRDYWGSAGVERPNTYNWMGVASPAADAMIDRMLSVESNEDFTAAVRALDRVLTSGRYVIPFYEYNFSRIAHAKDLKFAPAPIYGDWMDWQASTWWSEP